MMKRTDNDKCKAFSCRATISLTLALIVLVELIPTVCYASEPGLSLIAWFTIFPGEYISVFIYTYLIQIGRLRKRLLVGWFIFGHIIVPFFAAFFDFSSKLPEFVFLILPFCYWLFLLMCMLYFKKRQVFDDPQSPE